MKQFEAINKYNIMGNDYVRLDELMALIRQMQRKHRECKEPGYMHQNKEQSISADLALNHLVVVLNGEKIHVECLMKVLKTRFEREAKEQAKEQSEKPAERGKKSAIPARYTVWHYGENDETTQDSFGFVRFEKGIPMFSNKPCAVMWFVMKGAAENVAERLGEGFEVVDMWPVMTKEERLLRALFADDVADKSIHDDGDDVCEWNGDGTKAEDEDWDGDEEDGE